jgi:hypothetical protein
MSKLDIHLLAEKLMKKVLCGHGLKNGKKIAHRMWKMFQEEETRQKKLHPKEK